MNIYKHEFKMNLRSAITWSVSAAILIFLMMSIFSSMAADAELLNRTLQQMPQELLTAFGMTNIDMSTVLGFYSFAFLFCQVCLAIQASNYGFALVSIEESEMTADFLLAKPVKRATILTSKLLAALTNMLITNVTVWVVSFVAINTFRDGRTYDTNTLLLLLVSLIIFQLFFLSVGVAISLLMKRVRSVTTLSMALAFGMYVLSAFGGMLGKDSLDLITPFKHFEPNAIVTNGTYDTPLVVLNVAVTVVAIVGSYMLYEKRNVHTAV
ncbi:MAG: ABC transporter permease subunit [Ardenticatenaceae bacterium]|nr:ABC transporter permease subunit [Ardenticatenaceae bacterium]MCB9003002.1 ABC transporter permease subunit [Ardenticatenaceae bacterium]